MDIKAIFPDAYVFIYNVKACLTSPGDEGSAEWYRLKHLQQMGSVE